jgi:hypothetical protein
MNKTMLRVGAGAGTLGAVVLSLGLVLNNQANFSDRYVREQLVEHKINFRPVEGLTEEQKAVPCMVKYAGQQLATGKQAECYAKYQIGYDMLKIDGGRGYSETNGEAFQLRTQAAAALKAAPDDPATKALAQKSAEMNGKANSMLAGEAVKGLLLTAYGFGLLGERGGQAATACFGIGGALMVAMLVAFAMARARTREQTLVHDTDAPQPLAVQARETVSVG